MSSGLADKSETKALEEGSGQTCETIVGKYKREISLVSLSFSIMFRQEAHTSLGDNVERISVVKALWLVLEGK